MDQGVIASPATQYPFPPTPRYLPWILCGLLFIGYCIVSIQSTGFYQHDELGHLMQILHFWDSPLEYLANAWSRGGFKILYAIPTLLGYHAVIATNILFTTLSVYFSYRIAQAYQLRYPLLAIAFTGLQPFVINLSFRCYPEVPAMFFMTLLVYLYIQKKYTAVALIASFLFTIRAELAIFAAMLGVLFLLRRQWKPFCCLAIAPLLLNLLGWGLYGDPLYVVHLMIKGGITDTYTRNGFFYFWFMLPEITGLLTSFFFLTGYGFVISAFRNKWRALRTYHAVIIVFSVYFLMHCLFTSETLGFGRSGGVGRFLLVILPMVSVIALIGVNTLLSVNSKWKRLLLAGIAGVVTTAVILRMDLIKPFVFSGYATLTHITANLILLLLIIVLSILMILVRHKTAWFAGGIAVLFIFYTFCCVRPVPPTREDRLLTDAVQWSVKAGFPSARVHANHIVFTYLYGKATHDLSLDRAYDSVTVQQAVPGDIFIYDTHYSKKVKKQQLLNGTGFTVLKEFRSTKSSSKVWVVERKNK